MKQYAQITTNDLLALGVAIYGDKLPAWYRAFSITASYAKTADRLQDKDIEAVKAYLEINSHDYELKNIKTVRVSVKELTELLPCSRSTASETIKHCLNAGLLETVKAGQRGSSTLYIFLPPWKNSRATTSNEKQNRYTIYEEESIHKGFGNYEETTEPNSITNNIKGFGTYEENTEPNEQQKTQKGSVNLKKGSVNTPNRFGNYEEKGEPSIIIHNNPYLLIEEKNESAKKSERFTPYEVPTLEQVKNYCSEKGLNINPHSFFYHYAKSGWTANGQQVLDWRKLAEKFQQTESETEMTIESKPVYIAVCPHCVQEFNDNSPQRFTKNNATGKWQCSRFQSFTERELQKIIKQQDGKK